MMAIRINLLTNPSVTFQEETSIQYLPFVEKERYQFTVLNCRGLLIVAEAAILRHLIG